MAVPSVPRSSTRLRDVIDSGTLTAPRARSHTRFEAAVAELLGVEHVVACASGTAADPRRHRRRSTPSPATRSSPPSITDMGALTPILYQGAIPVFADVDPDTMNVTAETIEPRLSRRGPGRSSSPTSSATRATWTRSWPSASTHGIPVIEDSAQAFLARAGADLVGTIGAIGCFSLQQGKHITTGEGGLVVTNDAALARRMRLFVNKAWAYGEANPDHEFLALNYRITELQSAVLFAASSTSSTSQRRRRGSATPQRLTRATRPGSRHRHAGRGARRRALLLALLPARRPGASGARAVPAPLAEALSLRRHRRRARATSRSRRSGARCSPSRTRSARAAGRSRWPGPRRVDYSPERFPGTFAALEQVLVLPWNERYDRRARRLPRRARTAEAVASLEANVTEPVPHRAGRRRRHRPGLRPGARRLDDGRRASASPTSGRGAAAALAERLGCGARSPTPTRSPQLDGSRPS